MKKRLQLYFRMTAFRKGLMGSSRAWFGIWAAMAATRFVRKRLGKEPTAVERIVLRPGEAVTIRDTAIPRESFPA